METEKPPAYDATEGGICNPMYATDAPQQAAQPQAYPPAQQQTYPPAQPQVYPPAQQQVYPPAQQQVYPPAQQQVYPPAQQQVYPAGGSGYDGNMKGDVEANEVQFGVVGFDDKSIRLGFIRKVFAILALQMLVTVAITAVFVLHQPTKDYVQSSLSTYLAAYVVFIVLYFVLSCCTKLARKHPMNLILLGLFTLSLSYLVGAISSFHDTKIVLAAFSMTMVCTLAVVAFASQTRYDVTRGSGVLFCCSMSLLLFGIFAGALVPSGYMEIANVAYAALGALLFMGYLAFDIQTLIGGKKYELSPEDYVYAALQIYVDVVYIFLFILQLLGGSSGNN